MNVGQLYAQITLVTSQFDDALNSAGNKLSHFGVQLTTLGRDLMYLTAPLAGLGAGAISTGMDFEMAFAKIEGLVGITGDELALLEEAVKRLAGETAKSPNELADALYYVTSAGISASESIQVLEASAQAATSGLGKTQDVAKLVVFAINAYRDSGLTAAEATDILVAAVKNGTAEADALNGVIGRLLPTASELGISFNQVAGTLAVMTRTGLSASEASTSLSSIFSNLLRPSAAARKTLDGVGLSMDKLRTIAMHEPDGLIQVYRLLNDTLSDEQFATVVPNVRALRGAMNFLAQNTEMVDDVMQDVYQSAGDLSTAFGIAGQTAKVQFNQAMVDLELAMLDLWETMRGPVISAINTFRDIIRSVRDWFDKLSPSMKDTIVKIGALAVALGPVLLALGLFVKVVGGSLSVVGSLGKLLIRLLGTLPLIAKGFLMVAAGAVRMMAALINIGPTVLSLQGMVTAVKALGTAMTGFLLNPITLLVVGLAAVVIALIDFATANERGKERARDMMRAVVDLRGGFKSLEEAQRAAVEVSKDYLQVSAAQAGEWHNIALDMIPFIGAVRQASRDTERLAFVTEAAALAEIEWQKTLDAERVRKYNEALDETAKRHQDVRAVLTELGPEYELTQAAAEALARRFGTSASAIKHDWEVVSRIFKEETENIRDYLLSLPPDFEMTQEAAEEMAITFGVTADRVVLEWEKVSHAGEDAAVDMGHALGDISTAAEAAWRKFQDTAHYSMDDVRARIGVLQERLRELAKVDLAALGPSGAENTEKLRNAMETELTALIGFMNSGGKELGKSLEPAEAGIKLSVQGIADALGGMATSSDDEWKAFKKSTKDGAEDVGARIKKLQDRLQILKDQDLGNMGPKALAAWANARFATEQELGQLTTFVNEKGEIIATVLPAAINTSVTDSQTAFEDLLGLGEGTYEGITTVVETESPTIADTLADKIVAAHPRLAAEFDVIADEAAGTYGDVSDSAETYSGTAAEFLPEALRNSKNPLVQALVLLASTINTHFGGIKTNAGTWGENTGDDFIDRLTGEIRSGDGQIGSALKWATRGMQAFSPPRYGPLVEIDTWAKNMAKGWLEPFMQTIRDADLFSVLEPSPSFQAAVGSPMPGLARSMAGGSGDRMNDRGTTVNGGIHIGRVEVPRDTKDPRGFARAIINDLGEEMSYQATRISGTTRY